MRCIRGLDSIFLVPSRAADPNEIGVTANPCEITENATTKLPTKGF